ncbi:27 kDa hemolymph glycoprotein-like [Uranotaenia lowii]|uniref:27 kDa hemolymph glycoprotein-like n=1 Tax=Uranotaenia lowii TaxID=190385 RepID=UPI00247ADEA4|nr:27 kDa hemolymph glycoprotein-like [Uranotaenia lowii]
MSKPSVYLICLFGLIAVCLSKVINDINSSNSSEEDSNEADEMLSGFRSKCQKKLGSNETFGNILTESELLPNCMLGLIDLMGLEREIENLTAEIETRKAFFRKYCPQVQKSMKCLEPVTKEVRKCMDRDDAELFDVVTRAIPEALNLICKNDGALLFSDDGFTECKDNIIIYLGECANLIQNTTAALDIATYDRKLCEDLAAARSCFSDKLDSCRGSSWMQIFDLFYGPVVKTSPCKKFIKLEQTNLV